MILPVLLAVVCTVAVIALLHGYGSGWLQRSFKRRRCQYCPNVIGKWSAMLGVRNCNDCVRYMQMGRVPRHECTGTCPNDHGELIP